MKRAKAMLPILDTARAFPVIAFLPQMHNITHQTRWFAYLSMFNHDEAVKKALRMVRLQEQCRI